jgi:hypothetical protein
LVGIRYIVLLVPAPDPEVPTVIPRSPAQRATSRTNGARSHGPVTPEGKARSSLNATKHGLFSRRLLAPGEDPAAFEALLEALRAEHRPRSPTEALLVERLAATFWKLARCDRLEAELASCRPRPPQGRIYPDGTPILLTRTAELATLSAHTARLERALHRLLAALAARPSLSVPRTEPEAELAPAEEDASGSPATAAREKTDENEPERRTRVHATGSTPPAAAEAVTPAALSVARPPSEKSKNEPERVAPAAAPPEAAAAVRSAADPTAGRTSSENEENEPEPAPASSPAAAPAGLVAGDAEAARRAETPPPDPELALLDAARHSKKIARALVEDLAGEGELARVRRLLAALRTDLATLLAHPPDRKAA